MPIKVTHKEFTLDYIEKLFKRGTDALMVEKGKLWEGSFLLHSYIDPEKRIIHVFYFDPINGIELQEGQDIRSVDTSVTIFKTI